MVDILHAFIMLVVVGSLFFFVQFLECLFEVIFRVKFQRLGNPTELKAKQTAAADYG